VTGGGNGFATSTILSFSTAVAITTERPRYFRIRPSETSIAEAFALRATSAGSNFTISPEPKRLIGILPSF
jgi:hypothetical protein